MGDGKIISYRVISQSLELARLDVKIKISLINMTGGSAALKFMHFPHLVFNIKPVCNLCVTPQIARFMGPTWGPPGSCRPQMAPMLAPWILLSGTLSIFYGDAWRCCCMSRSMGNHWQRLGRWNYWHITVLIWTVLIFTGRFFPLRLYL